MDSDIEMDNNGSLIDVFTVLAKDCVWFNNETKNIPEKLSAERTEELVVACALVNISRTCAACGVQKTVLWRRVI
jgi:mevalonate kinase